MTELRRRAVLAGTLAAMTTPAHTTPDDLAFRMLRHGGEIGRHSVAFRREGARLTAHILVDLRVGLGPFTFYRYHHEAYEVWQDDAFVSLDSSTDKNGTPLTVAARRGPAGIAVTATGSPHLLLPENTIPFTHWNEKVVRMPLFDPQDGTLAPERVTPRGADPAIDAEGTRVPATRYDFNGRATIVDWYDEQNVWAALQATAPDGSIITYERL